MRRHICASLPILGAVSPILKRSLATLVFLLAAGFALDGHTDTFVREDIIADPDPAQFNICYDHSCTSLARVSLGEDQWQRIRSLFAQPASTPSAEREQIRSAIALFETVVGAMTGTAGDKGGNWAGFGLPRQLDCIDESTNTSIYLLMLQKYGLLRWHSVADRATRWSLFSWAHTTAVIEEGAVHGRWAVDSWFLDNGEPPFVLPLEVWRQGWKPPRKDTNDASGAADGVTR